MKTSDRLSFEPDRTVRDVVCDHCGMQIRQVTGFIDEDGGALAIYWAFCHHDPDGHEVYIEATFSPTWEDGVDDHVTFTSRFGRVDGGELAATMIDGLPASARQVKGHLLSREEGLAHPWVETFWRVLDFIVEADPDVHAHMYGGAAAPSSPPQAVD